MSSWRSRTLTDIVLELHVPDFAKAKAFYRKLGFKTVWERKPVGTNGYLVMRQGASVICFYCGNKNVYRHPYFKKFSSSSPKGYAMEIAIPVQNIIAFYKKVVHALGKHFIIQPLTAQSYDIVKKRDFRITDCFGFYIRFTEPMNVLYKE